MDQFKRFITSRYFTFLSIFLIIFSITSVILLDVNHPLYFFSIGCGLVVFLLQRYRKSILKN